jgi:HEAT repeat protein
MMAAMRYALLLGAATVLLGCGPSNDHYRYTVLDNQVVVENIEKLGSSDPDVVIQAARELDDYSDPAIAQALIDHLAHPDADVQEQLVKSLAHIGEAAVEPLIARLESPGSAALTGAVLALDFIGDERAVGPLIDLLKKNLVLDIHVFNALEAIGEPSIDPLIALLSDVDPNVRFRAARALAHLEAEQASEPLVAMLGEVQETQPLLELIISMGHKPVPALIGALSSSDVTVRELAAIALEQITLTNWHPDLPAALASVLDDESTTVRLHAAIALGRTKDKEIVPPLGKALEDENAEVCQAAAASLAQLRDPVALPDLLDYIVSLKSDPWSGGVKAVRALLPLASTEQKTEAAQILMKMIEHDDVRVRAAACDLLGDIPREEHLEILLERMRGKFPLVRQFAGPSIKRIVREIAKGDAPAAEKIVLDMAQDDSHLVRDVAADLLPELMGKKAIGPLSKMLKDEDYRLVCKAALLLHEQGDDSGVAPVVKLLKSEQEPAVMKAWDTLDRMGELDTDKVLLAGIKSKTSYMRASAVDLLGNKKDKKYIPVLSKMLGDEDLKVAESAARALGKLGKPAIKPLVKALKSKNGPHDAVSMALVSIGPDCIKSVIGALSSKNKATLVHAARVLGQLGAFEAVKPLIKLLESKDPDVRQAARNALLGLTCTDLGDDYAAWKKWYDEGNFSGKGCISDKSVSIENVM